MHPEEHDSGTVALIAIAVLTAILVIASIVSVESIIIIIQNMSFFLIIARKLRLDLNVLFVSSASRVFN